MLRKKGLRPMLLYICGILAALPVSFTQLSFLAFFSFVPALLLLMPDLLAEGPPCRARRWYGYGLCFCMGFFMLTFHWFTSLYPLDFVRGMTPPLAVLVILAACVGLPLLQSLGFAFLFLLLALFSRTRAVRRFPLSLPFLWACGWVLFAYTQTLTWAGVPWGAQLALSQQKNLLLLSSASFFGSYFVTFIIAAVNACLATAILSLLQKKWPACRTMALVALCLFLGNLGLGTLAYHLPQQSTGTVRAAVLQGNIGSADKWTGAVDELAVYRRLAREAADAGAELMVWPETALPYALNGNSYATAALQSIAQETGAIQIVGAFYADTNGGDRLVRRNALYMILPNGRISETRYDKRHLVPFGEYVPMEGLVRTLLPFLSGLNMLQDDRVMLPGDTPALWESELGCLGGLICFDSIYEGLARDSVAAGAELLVLGTNDSWFFDSAAVYQHNGQAILRAVENGRALLRSANTGISSIISEKGETLAELEPLIDGMVCADVSLSAEKTLYTVIGDLFVFLAALFFHLPALVYVACRAKDASNKRKNVG